MTAHVWMRPVLCFCVPTAAGLRSAPNKGILAIILHAMTWRIALNLNTLAACPAATATVRQDVSGASPMQHTGWVDIAGVS